MNRRAAAASAITIQTQKQTVSHRGAPSSLTVGIESCESWLFSGSELSASEAADANSSLSFVVFIATIVLPGRILFAG
jgi:hypothetical protein